MKLAVELEFPDEQAALALQWLQNLPSSFVARLQGRQMSGIPSWLASRTTPLSDQERRAVLDELMAPLPEGAETADEMIQRIYGDRRDQPREVEL